MRAPLPGSTGSRCGGVFSGAPLLGGPMPASGSGLRVLADVLADDFATNGVDLHAH